MVISKKEKPKINPFLKKGEWSRETAKAEWNKTATKEERQQFEESLHPELREEGLAPADFDNRNDCYVEITRRLLLERNDMAALKILSCLSWDEQTRIASELLETDFF